MLATPQHRRPSLVQNNILVGVRKLLSRERIYKGNEHSSTAHASDSNGIQHTPAVFAIASARVVLAVVLCHHGVAGVTTDGEHMCVLSQAKNTVSTTLMRRGAVHCPKTILDTLIYHTWMPLCNC